MAKSKTRHVAFVLTAEVERALVEVLHEVEREQGRRVSWDEAFRRLLTKAGVPLTSGNTPPPEAYRAGDRL